MVAKVLTKPAWIPFGGSLVTLIVFYKRPRGNLGVASQVIQSLKSSWIGVSGLIISSILFINPRPRWQFYKITQVPASKASSSLA